MQVKSHSNTCGYLHSLRGQGSKCAGVSYSKDVIINKLKYSFKIIIIIIIILGTFP